VSELQERHTEYELREQYICEQYWPAGGAAESYKTVLIGKIIGQRISFDEKEQQNIQAIIKMLEGTFDMEKDIPARRGLPPPEQMKMYL